MHELSRKAHLYKIKPYEAAAAAPCRARCDMGCRPLNFPVIQALSQARYASNALYCLVLPIANCAITKQHLQTGHLGGQHHIRLAAVTVSVSSSGLPHGEVPVSISLCQLIYYQGVFGMGLPAWGHHAGAGFWPGCRQPQ